MTVKECFEKVKEYLEEPNAECVLAKEYNDAYGFYAAPPNDNGPTNMFVGSIIVVDKETGEIVENPLPYLRKPWVEVEFK